MLPTKGFFHDIECPYLESGCGRPFCHFRHRKKLNEENVNEPDKVEVPEVPTYKPTPKSELANFQNNRSHIPISYVPDTFRPDRVARPKFERPTYKPTPLSILSASKTSDVSLEENGDKQAIKEIKENIADNEYNPFESLTDTKINFEDLSGEFDMLDEIINDDVEAEEKPVVQYSPTKIKDLENAKKQDEKKTKCVSEGKKTDDKSVKDSSKKISSDSEKHKSGDISKNKSSEGERNKSGKDRHDKTGEKSARDNKSSDNKHKSRSKPKEKSHSSDKSHKSSSRDKHRKEEKKHTHKSDRSKDRSKEKSKESDKKDRHKSDKKRHKSDRDKKDRDKGKVKKKAEDERKKHRRRSTSSNEISDNNVDVASEVDLSDVDFDNEDETMMECFKIFNEYKPEPKVVEAVKPVVEEDVDLEEVLGKKRVAHSNAETSLTQSKFPVAPIIKTMTPGQTLTERYRVAKLAQANREQENIRNEVKQPLVPVKRSAPTLLEAARQHKLKKLQTAAAASTNLVDDIINGKTATPPPKPTPVRKIAPVQNLMSYQKGKERMNELAKQKAAAVFNKTIAQTQKSGRVAHVPEISLPDIPDVLDIGKSKLPVNVRTKYLVVIAEECVKLYLTKNDAYKRALNEEFACYEKCKVVLTYRNSAMLAVNRLRKEVQEREKLGLGPIDSGETSTNEKGSEYSGKRFYKNVREWCLTEEELDIHGYPRESNIPGKAIIKNRREIVDRRLDENQRKCCRCNKIYMVDDDGWPLYEEECLYHPLKKRTIRGEQTYLCCRATNDSGCASSDTHVSEALQTSELEGFQTTMDPEEDDDPRSTAVYALDCEMCYTTKGLELTRVTIIDTECKTVYESLVKPLNPIIDYNTMFSGITKEQMDKTSTSILQIQANILHLCNSQTILVGHSLESDLKALKIVHSTVIDTSVLFPHKMGLPHKRALRALASEYLKKIIQNDVSGHDSAEDAVTCMELIRWKLKEELKIRSK